jgi:hypothetical protein
MQLCQSECQTVNRLSSFTRLESSQAQIDIKFKTRNFDNFILLKRWHFHQLVTDRRTSELGQQVTGTSTPSSQRRFETARQVQNVSGLKMVGEIGQQVHVVIGARLAHTLHGSQHLLPMREWHLGRLAWNELMMGGRAAIEKTHPFHLQLRL